jgi:hypothetical protein
MRSPRGFGKTYFSLAAIQAYASQVRLLQNITRIELVAPVCPIYIYSAVSPPKSVLLSSIITIINQGHTWSNIPYHSSHLRHSLLH